LQLLLWAEMMCEGVRYLSVWA